MVKFANGLLALVIVGLIVGVGTVSLLTVALVRLVTGQRPLNPFNIDYPRR